jgi:hypothetical protein
LSEVLVGDVDAWDGLVDVELVVSGEGEGGEGREERGGGRGEGRGGREEEEGTNLTYLKDSAQFGVVSPEWTEGRGEEERREGEEGGEGRDKPDVSQR